MSNEENGFLTERDKAFLQADDDYYTGENAKNQRYETREVIAARARQAFHDFALLYDVLDEHERDRIFDVGIEGHRGDAVIVDREAVESFRDAIADTVAFLYLALEGEIDDTPPHRSMSASFEQIIQAGIARGEVDRRPGPRGTYFTDVDLSVSVMSRGSWRPERAIEKLAEYRAHDLSESELRGLVIAADPETTGTTIDDWSAVGRLIEAERQADDVDE